jgi:CheY-like chemotaxis protein
VNMPEMNGYDLAEFLRSRNPQLPVLFMSAALDNEAPQRRRSVIRKPFTVVGLIEGVAAALHSYPNDCPDRRLLLNKIKKGEQECSLSTCLEQPGAFSC